MGCTRKWTQEKGHGILMARSTRNLHLQALSCSARSCYQSMIDQDLLDKGENYMKLRNTVVIFICKFDLFGLGDGKYSFHSYEDKHKELQLQDGSTSIFLNTKSALFGLSGARDSRGRQFHSKIRSCCRKCFAQFKMEGRIHESIHERTILRKIFYGKRHGRRPFSDSFKRYKKGDVG